MTNAEQNGVLRWTGKVLSADDLRRHLKGQRELIVQRQAIVTPLAVDELKTRGVRLVREDACRFASTKVSQGRFAYAEEYSSPLIGSSIHALAREGVRFEPLQECAGSHVDWARALAESVARGEWLGAVVFCSDPGLVCCVANKIGGVRAASVLTVMQAGRALATLGANLLAVEMPGRTFFEIRQILSTLCRAKPRCPDSLAATLKELDGHAHR